jgi:hypothetical protein
MVTHPTAKQRQLVLRLRARGLSLRQIADAMGKLAKAELRQRGRLSGTQRARKGKRAS